MYILYDEQTKKVTTITNDYSLAVSNLSNGQVMVEIAGVKGSDLHAKKYIDGSLVDDEDEIYNEKVATIRSERNDLLKVVDEISSNPLRWGELSLEKQNEWAQYRIDLLSVPQQEGFPDNIVWPIKPE